MPGLVQKLLIVVGAVAAFRAFQPSASRTDRRTAVAFVGLRVALSLLAEIPVATQGGQALAVGPPPSFLLGILAPLNRRMRSDGSAAKS